MVSPRRIAERLGGRSAPDADAGLAVLSQLKAKS